MAVGSFVSVVMDTPSKSGIHATRHNKTINNKIHNNSSKATNSLASGHSKTT